jgi:murein L,D-transpeptidase YcbB/YkuD
MNEVKYQITQLVFLVLLGLAAYWALTNLDTGVTYTRDQMIDDVEIADTLETTDDGNQVNQENVLTPNTSPVVDEPLSEPVVESNSTNQDTQTALIESLQKLADDNVSLNSGANGESVASVQQFLDIYFTDKTVSVDKDFGPTTKGLVEEFQQKELNGGDGRIGPNTLKAMVSYLKK